MSSTRSTTEHFEGMMRVLKTLNEYERMERMIELVEAFGIFNTRKHALMGGGD